MPYHLACCYYFGGFLACQDAQGWRHVDLLVVSPCRLYSAMIDCRHLRIRRERKPVSFLSRRTFQYQMDEGFSYLHKEKMSRTIKSSYSDKAYFPTVFHLSCRSYTFSSSSKIRVVVLDEDFFLKDPADSELWPDVDGSMGSSSSTRTNLAGSSKRRAFTKACAIISCDELRIGTYAYASHEIKT